MAKKGLQYYQLFLGLAAGETVNTHQAQLTKLKRVRDSLGGACGYHSGYQMKNKLLLYRTRHSGSLF